MSVKQGLKTLSSEQPLFSNNQVSNLINICKIGYANASFLLHKKIDQSTVLNSTQKTNLKSTINNKPFANVGRTLQDLDTHTENILNGSLGEEVVVGSGERGTFLDQMQVVDGIVSQTLNLKGVTASSQGKGVDDHFGTLRIQVIDSHMKSLEKNLTLFNALSLTAETDLISSLNALTSFLNTIRDDSTDFQTTLDNLAADVELKNTALEDATDNAPALTYKNEIKDAEEFVRKQIAKETTNLGSMQTYLKNLSNTSRYVSLAQNDELRDLIGRSSENANFKDYFDNYNERKNQFNPLMDVAPDSSQESLVEKRLQQKGLPDVTNYLDLRRVANKAKRDTRLQNVDFEGKSEIQVIALASERLGIIVSGRTVYDQSQTLLDNMNKNDVDVVKEELRLSQQSNTLT